MKKVLFVMNTMGRGGAEVALIQLLKEFDPAQYQVDFYVMLGQGELMQRVPGSVHRLNRRYDPSEIQSSAGKRRLLRHLAGRLLSRGALVRNLPYLVRNYRILRRGGEVRWDKLLWRPVTDGTAPLPETYDLAVAYLEGAATYFVAEKVRARRKAAFIHVDCLQGVINRELDGDCYQAFDKVFCVSEDVLASFVAAYPEHESKSDVVRNIIDQEEIRRRSRETGGFPAEAPGYKLLTVGRLVPQKAYEYSIETMAELRRRGVEACWIVLGEGQERKRLEKLIAQHGLEDCFLLPGMVDNPYPYFAQSDLYVHCSRFEGQSIAVREAMTLGCAVVVSDSSGNRDQVDHGIDGWRVPLEVPAMADAIQRLLDDDALRRRLGEAAAAKDQTARDTRKLFALLEE